MSVVLNRVMFLQSVEARPRTHMLDWSAHGRTGLLLTKLAWPESQHLSEDPLKYFLWTDVGPGARELVGERRLSLSWVLPRRMACRGKKTPYSLYDMDD